MHKPNKASVAAVAISGIILAGAGVAGAEAAGLIGSGKIKDDSIRSVDLKDGAAVGMADLKPGLRDKVSTDSDTFATATYETGSATVANIGGSFGKFTETVRATELATVTLEPGTYVVTADGFFVTNDATSGLTRMQLALRVDDGSEWGVDHGTCFTGAVSVLADREASCSTTRVVEVEESTDVVVYGFGYQDDQGSADSGKIDATAHVTALSVG